MGHEKCVPANLFGLSGESQSEEVAHSPAHHGLHLEWYILRNDSKQFLDLEVPCSGQLLFSQRVEFLHTVGSCSRAPHLRGT